ARAAGEEPRTRAEPRPHHGRDARRRLGGVRPLGRRADQPRASEARRRSQAPGVHPHGARHRLLVHRRRGVSERPPAVALHRSVFVRLVAVMMAMSVCVMVMVFGFYFYVVLPGLHTSVGTMVGQTTRAIADSGPGPEEAK